VTGARGDGPRGEGPVESGLAAEGSGVSAPVRREGEPPGAGGHLRRVERRGRQALDPAQLHGGGRSRTPSSSGSGRKSGRTAPRSHPPTGSAGRAARALAALPERVIGGDQRTDSASDVCGRKRREADRADANGKSAGVAPQGDPQPGSAGLATRGRGTGGALWQRERRCGPTRGAQL